METKKEIEEQKVVGGQNFANWLLSIFGDDDDKEDFYPFLEASYIPPELPKVRDVNYNPLKYRTEMLEKFMRQNGFPWGRMLAIYPLPKQPARSAQTNDNMSMISDSCPIKTGGDISWHGHPTVKMEESSKQSCEAPKQPKDISTSTLEAGPGDHNSATELPADYLILYSYYMSFILSAVATQNIIKRKHSSHPEAIVSGKQLNIIETALKFYVPIAIWPYSDEDVTLQEGKRYLVEEWKPKLQDKDFRIEQLNRALNVFDLLIESCDDVRSLIIKKFLGDYICLNEQLIALGNGPEQEENYLNFLMAIDDRCMLFSSLLVLRTGYTAKPEWFTVALGTRINEFLMIKNGLYHLFKAVTNERNFFEDFEFMQLLAKILAKLPWSIDADKYREFLVNGLLNVLEFYPNAENMAYCFALVMDQLPERYWTTVFHDLLLPWQKLSYVIRRKDALMKRQLYNRALDRSLKVLPLCIKSFSPTKRIPWFHRFKDMFSFWIILYASTLKYRKEAPNLPLRQKVFWCAPGYSKIAEGISTILNRILDDVTFGTVEKEAEFILRNIEHVCHTRIVELNFSSPKEAFTDATVTTDTSDTIKSLKYWSVDSGEEFLEEPIQFHHKAPEKCVSTKCNCDSCCLMTALGQPLKYRFEGLEIIVTEPNKSWDVFVRLEKGISAILFQRCMQREGAVCSRLLIITVMHCMKRLAQLDLKAGSANKNVIKRQLNYFLADLLPALGVTKTVSDEDFAKLIDIPVTVLNNITELLNVLMRGMNMLSTMDVDLCRKNANISITILYGMVEYKNTKIATFTKHLKQAAEALDAFLQTVNKIHAENREPCAFFQCKASYVLHLLKKIIHSKKDDNDDDDKNDYDDVYTSSSFESSSSGSSGSNNYLRDSEFARAILFHEIYTDLLDESVHCRKNSLIMLTKGIQKKNRKFMTMIDDCPFLIDEVMKLVADDDSDVYLAAIDALIEMAHWKQLFFNHMVELFVDPKEKLKTVFDSNRAALLNDEGDTYLFIQRVKIGKAISRAKKAKLLMLSVNFDRLINAMLSLLPHATEDRLRAIVISSLSDLVKNSCHRLDIHKYSKELLLISKSHTADSEVKIVRRAAIKLAHSVLKRYDIRLLGEVPSHFCKIYESMKHVLDRDENTTAEKFASLSLQDVGAHSEGENT